MISVDKNNISATIKNRYASIVYSFAFKNTNETGSQELKFEITINAAAFISGFKADIDGEIFHGQTKEKNQAKKEYSDAKEKDENAILISQPYQNIPNVFLISTNIDAKSKIKLDISIEEYLTKIRNYNELNIQLLNEFNSSIFTPNYKQILFDITVQDSRGVYDVNVPSESSDCLTINTADAMKKSKQTYHINGKIEPNSMSEFELKYKVKGEHNDSSILYDNNSKTFCHIISDVITDHIRNEGDSDRMEIKNYDNILISRRVVWVIDRSGSMSGSKWRKAISSTIKTLKQLRNGYDKYAIILFDDYIEMFNEEMIMANTNNICAAVSWLNSKDARSSTDINTALMKAIETIKNDIELVSDTENFFMNQIIFITDGEPNKGVRDTKKIILNVKSSNNLTDIYEYGNKISIFSFGVGSDRNNGSWVQDLDHSFLKLLSLNNNGIYKRIKQSSADTKLTQYFDILSKPILSNININYDSNSNDFSVEQLTLTNFDTLYSGSDIIICGKINNNNSFEKQFNITATISAITGKEIRYNDKVIIKPLNITKNININLLSENNSFVDDNIEKVWAYLKLQDMIKQKLLNSESINDKEALSLAMKYKFVTPWTSMIVVKSKQEMHNYPTPINVDMYNNDVLEMKQELRKLAKQSLYRQCSSIAAPNMLESYTNKHHRRDSSVPVVSLGFGGNPDVLLHYEKLKVKDLESELEKTLNEIDEVKSENKMFKNKLNEFEKEQKEKELKLIEITASKSKLAEKCAAEIMRLTNIINKLSQIPQLKDAILLLTNNWRQWNYLQIIKWIIELQNNKYKKYENILKVSMKNINGMNLVNMTKDNLKQFGIDNINDCEAIWEEIQILIKC